MAELINPTPHYESPLRIVNPSKRKDFRNIETFRGSVEKLIGAISLGIDKIEAGSQTEKEATTLFYRTYELIKMTVEEKIDVDRSKKGYTETAISAIRLATDLAIACGLKDKNAGEIFGELKGLVKTTKLKSMLKKRLEESTDFAITPEHPAEADLEIAQNLVAQTGGKDILLIGIGHRGIRRSLDIFLDYRTETNTPGSVFWPVRFSVNRGDRIYPNISWQEVDDLKKIATDKTVVIIGPAERLEGTVEHLKQIMPKDEKAIGIALPVQQRKK